MNVRTTPARLVTHALVALLSVLLALALSPTAALADEGDPGSLVGKVTDVRNAPLGDIRVEALRFDSNGERIYVGRTYTAFDGTYSLEELPAGRYYLRLSDPAADYATAFSSGASRPTSPTARGTTAVTTTQATAETVELAGAGGTTLLAGYLTKEYTDPEYDDNEVEVGRITAIDALRDDVDVAAYDSAGKLVASAITYGGEYELAVPTVGTYTLRIPTSRHADTLAATISAKALQGQRVVLPPKTLAPLARPGSFAGLVVDAAGDPVPHAGVRLIDVQDAKTDDDSDNPGEVDYADTDEEGRYVLGRAEVGVVYTVEVESRGQNKTYAGDGETLAGATTYKATSNQQTVATITVPGRTSAVSGQVTLPAGEDTSGVTVVLERWTDGAWGSVATSEPEDVDWDGQDEPPGIVLEDDGTWRTAAGVGDGTYRAVVRHVLVEGEEPEATTPVGQRWFGSGRRGPEGPRDTGSFTLSRGASKDGVDIDLPPASVVSGTVTDPQGDPVTEGDISLYRWDETSEDFERLDDDSFVHRFDDGDSFGEQTDARAGRYALNLDGPGTYTLHFRPEYSGLSDLAPSWLGGGTSKPTEPTRANSFTVVAGAPEALTEDLEPPAGVSLSGVVRVAGTPTGVPTGATLEFFTAPDPRHPDDGLDFLGLEIGDDAPVYADEDGRWNVQVPVGKRITYRVSRLGMQDSWFGGSSAMPEKLDASNSFVATRSRTDFVTSLVPVQTDLGRTAGEQFSFCYAEAFRARRFERSSIEFPVNVGGTIYDDVVVTADGALSFSGAARGSKHLPLGNTGNPPVIAPLLASARTVGDRSMVSYGVSPDGQQLCAVWHEVVSDEKSADNEGTNTFQVLLTRPRASSMRMAGDVDVRFNYDRVSWGRAVSGTGSSAQVKGLEAGWSASDGSAERTLRLDGSGKPDAFVTGGTRSLTSGSLGGAVPGRYDFSITNAGAVPVGQSVSGTVRGPSGALANATVQLCRQRFYEAPRCETGTSDSTGAYRIDGLAAGRYVAVVWPASGDFFMLREAPFRVITGGSTVHDVDLVAPTRLPSGSTVASGGRTTTSGVPSVLAGTPIRVTTPTGERTPVSATIDYYSGERSQSPEMEVESANGTAVVDGLVAEQPGQARVVMRDELYDVVTQFDVYVLPRGLVTDQYGRALAGASTRLLRSDLRDGSYAAVANGSRVMSPGNRTNPTSSTTDGAFGWDVIPGFYRVRATATSCSQGETDVIRAPGDELGLLALTCDKAAPTPQRAPSIVGDPAVGNALRVAAGRWPGRIAPTGWQWQRDGVAIEGATGSAYVVTAADAGSRLSVVETAERPAQRQLLGGTVVVFSPVQATTTAVRVSGPPTATKRPMVSGTPVSGSVLTSTTGTWDQSGLTFAYQWLRDGKSISGATSRTYTLTLADAGTSLAVRVSATNSRGLTSSATSEGLAVTAPAPRSTSAPVVSGTPISGAVLSSTSGEWDQSGLAFAYQWLRDGKAISGATGPTYTLTLADAGTAVSAQVTASNSQKQTGTASSNALAVTAAAPRSTSAPTVSGSPAADSVLSTTTGGWDQSGLTYAYQWTRDGSVVTGATKAAYTVTNADAGKSLAVTVTATNSASRTGQATSAGASIARLTTTTSNSVTTVKGKKKGKKRLPSTYVVNVMVTAPAGVVVSGPASVVVDKKVRRVNVVRGKATVSIGRLAKGKHTVQTTFLGNAQLAPSTASLVSLTIRR